MLDGKCIRGVDANSQTFIRGLNRIKDPNLQREIIASLRGLFLLDVDHPPAKLHLHQLVNKQVQSVLDPLKKVKPWTFHVTSDDRYKASFTLENGTAYLRICDEHDRVDKNP